MKKIISNWGFFILILIIYFLNEWIGSGYTIEIMILALGIFLNETWKVVWETRISLCSYIEQYNDTHCKHGSVIIPSKNFPTGCERCDDEELDKSCREAKDLLDTAPVFALSDHYGLLMARQIARNERRKAQGLPPLPNMLQ